MSIISLAESRLKLEIKTICEQFFAITVGVGPKDTA